MAYIAIPIPTLPYHFEHGDRIGLIFQRDVAYFMVLESSACFFERLGIDEYLTRLSDRLETLGGIHHVADDGEIEPPQRGGTDISGLERFPGFGLTIPIRSYPAY